MIQGWGKGKRAVTSSNAAFAIIRPLIDEVRLMPEHGELRVEIRGVLAGILALSAQNNVTGVSLPRAGL
ncbi:hypothetical protein [Acidocella aromatica]|uniref:Uncharacterized protein n=1 Tax=Acidocella aromatica TaxID=1303579 RepID=A0A840VFC0_9PROT|nr:hypothetical protein [Acidocella aromatica]MBB5374504.1 hypothetical protein [Acidocella aromatica]